MNEISATMGIEQLKKLPFFLKEEKKFFIIKKKIRKYSEYKSN